MQVPNSIPEHPGDEFNIFYLFLTEVILSHAESYISFTSLQLIINFCLTPLVLKHFDTRKPPFEITVVKLQKVLFHTFSYWNCLKSILLDVKNSFHLRKCNSFTSLSSFWHFVKNISCNFAFSSAVLFSL